VCAKRDRGTSIKWKPYPTGALAPWEEIEIFRAKYAPGCVHISKLSSIYLGDVNSKLIAVTRRSKKTYTA
jgi:hypothetical protein